MKKMKSISDNVEETRFLKSLYPDGKTLKEIVDDVSKKYMIPTERATVLVKVKLEMLAQEKLVVLKEKGNVVVLSRKGKKRVTIDGYHWKEGTIPSRVVVKRK